MAQIPCLECGSSVHRGVVIRSNISWRVRHVNNIASENGFVTKFLVASPVRSSSSIWCGFHGYTASSSRLLSPRQVGRCRHAISLDWGVLRYDLLCGIPVFGWPVVWRHWLFRRPKLTICTLVLDAYSSYDFPHN